jgi:alkylation response protein AidB-like acyl-CoA dehydrogenase
MERDLFDAGHHDFRAMVRDFLDARASTLYAGTTEVMKEIIGRSLRA